MPVIEWVSIVISVLSKSCNFKWYSLLVCPKYVALDYRFSMRKRDIDHKV